MDVDIPLPAFHPDQRRAFEVWRKNKYVAGHGPAKQIPANYQSFDGRSTGTNWGPIKASTGVSGDTNIAVQYGHITYSAIEVQNAPGGRSEWGRVGEIKILYTGVTAMWLADGIALGPPDVALGPNNNTVYGNAGNWTANGIIWRYAATAGATNWVINDFSVSRGDIINIVPGLQSSTTVANFSWGTKFSFSQGGTISIYNVQLGLNNVSWAG